MALKVGGVEPGEALMAVGQFFLGPSMFPQSWPAPQRTVYQSAQRLVSCIVAGNASLKSVTPFGS